jgi:hypothetical protein
MPATISATSERKQSKGAWDLEWIQGQLTQLTSLFFAKKNRKLIERKIKIWKLMETDG